MSRFLLSICLARSVFFLGCDEAAMLKRYAPLQDEPIARKYLDLLMAGQVDEIPFRVPTRTQPSIVRGLSACPFL